MIDTNNPTETRLEAERRLKLRAVGQRTFGTAEVEKLEIPHADQRALEKQIEAQADKLMLALGFEVVRLSQARASKIHPGLPDRRYYRRPRVVAVCDWRGVLDHYTTSPALAVWAELKSATGKQRPDQRAFQEMVEACSEAYVLGGIDALVAWLESQGLGTMVDGAFEPKGEG